MDGNPPRVTVVTYRTPLAAYFRQEPQEISEYCQKFLIKEFTPEKRKGSVRQSKSHETQSYKMAKTLEQSRNSTNQVSNQSILSEELEQPQLFAISADSFAYDMPLPNHVHAAKRRLIAKLKCFGFPDEPDIQVENIFNIFETICEDFYAMKERFGPKMIELVVGEFKAAKHCKLNETDRYVVHDITLRHTRFYNASILRSVTSVHQIVKQSDFEVYKRELSNNGYEEVIDAVRERRELRKHQKERSEQLEQLESQRTNSRHSSPFTRHVLTDFGNSPYREAAFPANLQ